MRYIDSHNLFTCLSRELLRLVLCFKVLWNPPKSLIPPGFRSMSQPLGLPMSFQSLKLLYLRLLCFLSWIFHYQIDNHLFRISIPVRFHFKLSNKRGFLMKSNLTNVLKKLLHIFSLSFVPNPRTKALFS